MSDFSSDKFLLDNTINVVSNNFISNPLVSIRLVTYNHISYIRTSIESILSQDCEYPYELIICDDCSSDNTFNVLIEYQKKYPTIIRVLGSKVRLGKKSGTGYNNAIRFFNYCKGEYIAFLEGDDYWASSSKLQKQISYLVSNPSCSICTHWIEAINETNTEIRSSDFSNHEQPQVLTSDDLFYYNGRYLPQGTCFHSLSWVFRHKYYKHIPNWITKIRGGDHVIFTELLCHGHCYCIRENMGIYRFNSSSTWAPVHLRIKSLSQVHLLYRTRRHYRMFRSKIDGCIRTEFRNWLRWHPARNEYRFIYQEMRRILVKDPIGFLLMLKFIIPILLSYEIIYIYSRIRILLGKTRENFF